MELDNGLFKFTLRHSRRDQILLTLFAIISFPFLYATQELPKQIVNQAIGGSTFPVEIFGVSFDQLALLALLCALFLLMVIIDGAFKYYQNVFKGVVAERLLRRFRYMLIEHVIRFPLPRFRSVGQGEVVSIVTAETEPVGGFMGDSFSLPFYQGGRLLVLLSFIFVQNPFMGLAAISLYPLQAVIIPRLQKRVNMLAKQRIKHVRRLSERLGEMVGGIADVHGNDASRYERADFSGRLGEIYEVRFKIYKQKFFIKFLNNFLAQVIPFFFFSVGGYLVITGNLSFGALVAVLGTYKDLSAPWKELINYYQRLADARVKYDQIVEQFQPPGVLPANQLETDGAKRLELKGDITATGLGWQDEDGTRVIDAANFSFAITEHVAIIGASGSGKTELSRLLARQLAPTKGRINIGAIDLTTLPEAVTGRNLALVDRDSTVRTGSIFDNLLYPLKSLPLPGEPEDPAERRARRKRLAESTATGNSPYDINAEWIAPDAAGVADGAALKARVIEVLRLVDLENDLFNLALRSTIDPEVSTALSEGLLSARRVIRNQLQTAEPGELVEVFDPDRFNNNASVAENILFGTPLDDRLDLENISEIKHIQSVLSQIGLTQRFMDMGQRVASLMLEIFTDLPQGHEFFERYSFIEQEQLADFRRIINTIENQGQRALSTADKSKLWALPFKLVPVRHRLAIIDDPTREKLLQARKLFRETLPAELMSAVEFFDEEKYKRTASIVDNILFGKIASTKSEATSRIGDLVRSTIESIGLYDSVLRVGLDYDVGIGGKRLSAEQRQKLSLARAILKRPQVLILNEALSLFEPKVREQLFDRIKIEFTGRGLIWMTASEEFSEQFDCRFRIERGRVVPIDESSSGEAKSEEPTEDMDGSSGLGREVELLRRIPFFAGMDRARLKLLAFTAELQEFEPGQIMMRQGHTGDVAFVVLQGSTDIILATPTGNRTIATRGGHELLGELALITDAPRTATVRARERVQALRINRTVFFTLLKENPAVSINLARILAERLGERLRNLSGG